MKKSHFPFAAAVSCALLGPAFSVLAQSSVLTFSGTNVTTQSGPAMVIPVDINGDGHPGLVCANFGFSYSANFSAGTGGSGTTLSVFTNDGHGNLSLGGTLTVGLEPVGVAAADVNGDGKVDLISGNAGDNTLSVLTNNGKGSFKLEQTIAVGRAPSSVTTADINGNGEVDLISANYDDDTLSVLTNNGHGLFSLSATITVSAQPSCVKAADVNGDGKVDLICANSGADTLTVLTNNGRGGFSYAATIDVITGVGWVLATGVNGDGKVDLVTVGSATLSVFTNGGRGNFTLASSVSSPGSGMVAAGDFNGDGKMDLVCNYNGNGIQGFATILTNDGHGKFTATTNVPVGISNWQPIGGNYPNFVTAADFDGDGNTDVAVSCFGTAVLTKLTQTGVTGKPIITITSPANDAVIAPTDKFSIHTTAAGSDQTNKVEVVYFYLDGTKVFSVTTNAPFSSTNLVSLPSGTHGIQAVAIDSAGHIGYSPEIQVNVTGTPKAQPQPTISVTSPANGATISTGAMFTMKATATAPSGTTVGLVNFYVDNTSNLLAQFTKGPFQCPIYPGNIAAGNHIFFAVVVDSAGDVATSKPVAVTFKAAAAPVLVVNITSPTNEQSFATTNAITVKSSFRSTGSLVSLFVSLLIDGTNGAETADAPYSFTLPGGTFTPGEHTLQEIANGINGFGTSAVTHITINAPGTTLINFDALNTTQGAVSGATLTAYLASFGVKLTNVTAGTSLEAANQTNLSAGELAFPSSSPNFFTQAGASGPVSFTLVFAKPLNALRFTRVGLAASAGLLSNPQWTATAYDTNGTELSSVTEPLLVTNASAIPARTFFLEGDGIAYVTFASDSENVAAFSGVLLDDLFLERGAVTNLLSVSLAVTSPPTNDIIAPATIALSANVDDTISSSYAVSFYAGLDFLGTVSSPPYQFTWNNVLPGHYDLRASVEDSSGLTVRSATVPIVVQIEADSTLVNFEDLPTKSGPLKGVPVKEYLAQFGVGVASLSAGTFMTVERQRLIAGGKALNASSGSNVLTQTGVSGLVQFTLSFTNNLLSQFGFTRPELLANPFVSFPPWRVTAYDSAGAVVDQATGSEINSSIDVAAQRYSLSEPGGPGIAKVEFASEGSGLTTFNAMVVDDLVLTTNPAPFPPAVAITKPISGRVLTQPPSVTIAAEASDAADALDGAGIAKVSFYANGALLGADTSPPYTVNWKPGPRVPATYDLTAVAQSEAGLTWTSPTVIVFIRQPATQFGILNDPASQIVPAGGSATFTVVTTGTNGVSYAWTLNGATLNNSAHISGATTSSLVINPPISDADAGAYMVSAFSHDLTVSASATLTVIDPPTFSSQPQGQTVSPGTTVTLSPQATGGGNFTWQWLLNGAPIPSATNRIYAIPSAQPLQSGNYQVAVANQAASTLSAVAPVVVLTPTTIPFTNDNFTNRAVINPLLGPVAASNVGATTERGEPNPLAGYAASASIWFTWKPDFTGTVSLTTQGSDFDTVMAVYTGNTLAGLHALAGAADDDSGGYLTSLVTFNVTAGTSYQIAVDGFRGASGRVVLGFPAGNGYRVLNPSSGDSVPVIVRQPASRVVAPNATVVLSVGAVSATKISYQWYFQNAPIPGAIGSSLTLSAFQPGAVGVYDVLVANETGSELSEPANLQIANDQGATPTLTENKFVPANTSPTPHVAAFNLTPLAVGGDTRGFTVSQVFSTEGSTSEPGEPQPCGQVCGASQWFVYQTQIAGTFEVDTSGSGYNTLLGVYTGSGSSFADLVEVGCGYATNYLTEPQPSVVVPGVPKGETFYIVIDGYQGASGLAKLHIGLGTPLTVSNDLPNLLATAFSNVTIKVIASGSIPLAYEWQLNGVDLPGGNKPTYTVTNAQDDAVGNYTVILSNAVGVVTSAPPTALNLQYEPSILSGPTNETVLVGKPARFTVTALGVNVKTNRFFYQWYYADGAPIFKGTNFTLAFPQARWTNTGGYYLVISNSFGLVTSAPVTLTVEDKTLPTVAIKTPRNNLTIATNVVTLTGTAADNVGVAKVLVSVGVGSYAQAVGSNVWSFSADLSTGANLVTVRSVDLAGNVSDPARVNINYKPPVVPMVAKAVVSPDGPLAQAAGTYNGLFYPASGAAEASAGFFTATVAGSAGIFSANLLLDGGSYPFAGQFDPSGNAQTIIPRAGQTPLSAFLRLNLAPPPDQISGVISNASWVSTLHAERGASIPTPGVAGQFVIVIPSDAATPAGHLTVSDTSSGSAQVTGALADGAELFRLAPVSQDLAIPLYLPLYSGQGLFLGWISPTNTTTNFGPATWIKPGAANPISVWIVKKGATNLSN